MALQDLTPQLRTRLSRMERAVGWFVLLAAALLIFGFGYYVYTTAERKGWFLTKVPYFTFIDGANGLRVGDPVKLMGFDAGAITKILPQPADDWAYNVYVEFELKSPNYGYMWTEGSHARVATADFLGKRMLEVTRGTNGYPCYVFHPMLELNLDQPDALAGATNWRLAQEVFDLHGTNVLAKALSPVTNRPLFLEAGYTNLRVLNIREERKTPTGVWNDKDARYEYFFQTNLYWLVSDESPALTEQLEQVVDQVKQALPGVFHLTNELSKLMTGGSELFSNLNALAITAQPGVSNLAKATEGLDRPGGLGEWLLPTNIQSDLDATLVGANATLTSANTNLAFLALNLSRSLDNLADITSNLNSQVQANSNIITSIDRTIVDADAFVQGLKKHWLFRSAFKSKETNAPAPRKEQPLRTPNDPRRK